MNAVRKAKPRRAPVYFRVERLVRPETGEAVGALVPMTKMDVRTMRERRYTVGKELRADLKQSRNPQFYRLAHALGGWLADNVEGFEGLGQHAALKRLQELSGIGCTEEAFSIDLGSLGVHQGTRKVAASLNFEDMDEGEFSLLWQGEQGQGGWIGWLRLHKWGGLDPERMEEVERIIMGEHYE